MTGCFNQFYKRNIWSIDLSIDWSINNLTQTNIHLSLQIPQLNDQSINQSNKQSINKFISKCDWLTVETPRLVDLPTGALKPLLSGKGLTPDGWIVTLAPTSCVNIPKYSLCSMFSVSRNPEKKSEIHSEQLGSTLYSEGSFVRSFFSPKPFEVAMCRRTCGPKVLYSEVHLVWRLLFSEDSIFRKALHYMDCMLRSFFSPKFHLVRWVLCSEDSIFRKSPLHYTGSILRKFLSSKFL